jgi:hypothetical protein
MNKNYVMVGLITLSVNYVYADAGSESMEYAGQCWGYAQGAMNKGYKPENFKPKVIEVLQKYKEDGKRAATRIDVCRNDSKSAAEFSECLHKALPQNDKDFLSGFTRGLGDANSKDAQQAGITAGLMCISPKIK